MLAQLDGVQIVRFRHSFSCASDDHAGVAPQAQGKTTVFVLVDGKLKEAAVRATYRKMIQNLVWATGYNVVAIPLAAGALYAWGVVLTSAVGAALMAASAVIVAINVRLLS